MVIENLTQRAGEFREEIANLAAIRKWLIACSESEQAKHKDIKGLKDSGSIRDIVEWLNKNGEVMSVGKTFINPVYNLMHDYTG